MRPSASSASSPSQTEPRAWLVVTWSSRAGGHPLHAAGRAGAPARPAAPPRGRARSSRRSRRPRRARSRAPRLSGSSSRRATSPRMRNGRLAGHPERQLLGRRGRTWPGPSAAPSPPRRCGSAPRAAARRGPPPRRRRSASPSRSVAREHAVAVDAGEEQRARPRPGRASGSGEAGQRLVVDARSDRARRRPRRRPRPPPRPPACRPRARWPSARIGCGGTRMSGTSAVHRHGAEMRHVLAGDHQQRRAGRAAPPPRRGARCGRGRAGSGAGPRGGTPAGVMSSTKRPAPMRRRWSSRRLSGRPIQPSPWRSLIRGTGRRRRRRRPAARTAACGRRPGSISTRRARDQRRPSARRRPGTISWSAPPQSTRVCAVTR